jgi:hypothetical protein
MNAPMPSQLERRTIEAEIMDRMRAELASELGEDRALALLRRASQAAAPRRRRGFRPHGSRRPPPWPTFKAYWSAGARATPWTSKTCA